MTIAPTSPNAKRLYQFAERAHWQLPLPEVAGWLLRNGHFDPNDDQQLSRRIGANSRLRTRLLDWCNSSLFNWSTGFRSLYEASLVVDSDHMVRLAFLASIREFYTPNISVGNYSRNGLWKHGILVGIVASYIARISGRANHLDAFVAGTLHDIGLLAMEKLAPETFSNWLMGDELEMCDLQREELWFGTNHQDLGGIILKRWGFTKAITQSARYHSRPTEILNHDYADTCCCVSIANYLCSRSGSTSTGTHKVLIPTDDVFAKLAIDEERLRIIWSKLHPIQKACQTLV